MGRHENRCCVGGAWLAVLGLLAAAGCGDERLTATVPLQALRPMARPQTADVTPPLPTLPTPVADADPLAVPDPLAGTPDDGVADASPEDGKTPDPLADGDDPLDTPLGPKMPTQHSHWLRLVQYGERVTVRLNGVWYGDFSGPTERDITMALRPGPNTLTVTYRPQDAESWLGVHVLEGEHTPPIPELVTYQVAPPGETGETVGLTTTTRSFRFTAR